MKYYLVTNINNCEPEFIRQQEYVHVKTKADGSQTVIILNELIEHESVIELSKDAVQTLLNNWIDDENVNPPKDIEENDILQSKICINSFNFSEIAIEMSKLRRIERGYSKSSDLNECFPKTLEKSSKEEKRLFLNRLSFLLEKANPLD